MFNFAALVLNRVRANLLSNPIEDSNNDQLIEDAVNGKKISISSTNDEDQACLVNLLAMKFVKLRPDAVIPTKATDGSVGFDLTLLGMHSRCATDDTVIYCHTGLKVKPPPGYYIKIYPRSSISKSGYSVANSVGIVDVDYRGELLVALRQHKADAVITYPCKMAQLIPELDHSHIVSVEVDTIDDTARGEGGFGSTGK
ncbi:nudix hydrolase domain protein [Faustovirus]|nr:deoxyuridine 5'-triphosphate nucleotidohydrolase [Faustovirus]QJX72307.1 nudix hydrolase domain protein [Faustovirus]QJX73830.1 hypothetical protein F-E9_57 [Faustovirus]SMH63392.1 Deoxyuridine 5'-triphosphate nucleotidohydrolase [Faustovirus]